MSVYVAGGGGTHLEPRVASHYLAALLAEAGARGVLGTVTAVKTQQSEIDAPLDDLVIGGRLPDGTVTRLDLQITTTLSFTESDEKWQDVVPRAWDTFRQTDFDPSVRRIGIAVSQTTTKLERSVQPLLARARHAATPTDYRTRLAKPKGANSEQREFQRILDKLVKDHDRTAADDDIIDFMSCLEVIPFDLDKEDASRDLLASIDQLTPVASGNAEARKLWSTLSSKASIVIPTGGGVDRAAIVSILQQEGFNVGSDRAHGELIAALDTESRAGAASIRDTIDGKTINRDALIETVLDVRAEFRMLRIVGQHGTGKSAILKRLALEEPAGAPILLLRDLRVTGGGWAAHAAKFGRPMPLASLLREFGLCGSRTLFIDGADKMDAAIQVTVNDLLKVIADTPDLQDWRVIMTMREENAQRVEGWLDPNATAKMPSKTIRVEAFDDDESAEAASAFPLLRALLSDQRNYDTVLRRPFFLDALSRLPVPTEVEVRSEVDLVELWWSHGGADGADFAPAQGRRNALLTLGEQLLARPGRPLEIRGVDPVPLDELLRVGVLRHIDLGVTVAFSHDIYEEWILERILRNRRGDIAQALRDGGQNLQLVRPLQLLATHLLERSNKGDDWAALLAAVEADDLRVTWSRVVLSSPVRSVKSEAMLERIAPTLLRDEGRLLGRLILSVRTIETIRDLRFFDEKLMPDLSRDQRELFASQAAGPEIVTWMRLLKWLVPQLGSLPVAVEGETYPLLDAWVNAIPSVFAKYALVPEIAAWARSQIGDEDTVDERRRSWNTISAHGNVEGARALLIKSAAGARDVVRDYLATISKRALKRVRKQIVELSAGLALVLPSETSEFIVRAYTLDHSRTRNPRYHSGLHDRSETLGFDDQQDFYPASPARPPFLQLLRANPALGLDLIRSICNHAMEGWRRSWSETGGTPIPIEIDLGEGSWNFWGDDQTYSWFRGGGHVHILDSALLALDAWVHERLKEGDAPDDLCRRIARGNECNAVLGICAGVCMADLNAATTSPVAFAIGTHPALWQWDISRQIGDARSPSNEIGHWGGSSFLLSALRELNRLPHRQRTVRDLAVLFSAFAPAEVKERYTVAIATFLDRVPYGTAEERDDPSQVEAIRSRYEIFRQQADPASLVVEEKDGMTYFTIVPTYAASEKHQEMLADNAALNRVLRLYLWATKTVESGAPGKEIGLAEAFDEMVAMDSDSLFEQQAPIADMKRHHAQSAVSATAAVLAQHADDALWTRIGQQIIDVTVRAGTMTERADELSYRGSDVTGHPPTMAAHAYASLVRRDPAEYQWRSALLQLAVDPIEKVVEAVYDSAKAFADAAPDMIWRLFCLATQRGTRTKETGRGPHWSFAEAQEQSALSDDAERMLAEGVLPTAHPTPAAAGARGPEGVYHWDFHANALRLPIGPMLDRATRDPLLAHAASMIDWALVSLSCKGSRGDTPFEWLYLFYRWLGDLIFAIPAAELRTLFIARLDAAQPSAAAELMDGAMRHFMFNVLIDKRPIDAGQLEKWDALLHWAIARPAWLHTPADAREHDRGMALSAFLCVATRGIVCVVDDDWPNLDVLLPWIQRGAETFATERAAFAAMLALLRSRPGHLLPQPGLDWIQRVVRVRKADRNFWDYNSNGDRLVLTLREVVATGHAVAGDREIITEAADALIEMGVKGAAFLLQDLVKSKR
ncbi:hypothetical protein ACCS95_04260 [Rhizobium ruizarguesonis]